MKLKTKLSLSISLLVLVVVATVSGLYLLSLVHEQLRDIQHQARSAAQLIFNEIRREMNQQTAAGLLDSRQPLQVQAFLHLLPQQSALQTLFNFDISYPVDSPIRDVAVVSASQQVMADSNTALIGQILPPRPQLNEILHASSWAQLKTIFGPEQVYEVRLPMRLGATPLGAVRVGVDTVFIHSALAPRLHAILFSAALIIVLSTLLAVVFSDFLLAPLGALSRHLDRVARGEPAQAWVRRDEFGMVSSKIEHLGRQMQDVRQIYSALQEDVSRMLENIEEGVLLLDAQGSVRLASAAAERVLGRPAAELMAQPVEKVFCDNSELDLAVCRAVRQGAPLPAHGLARAPGQAPVIARLESAGEPESGERLLLLQDRAGRQQLENELEVARRLASIGRLTRGVAHEVKNPLNSLAIQLNLIDTKLAPEAQAGVKTHLGVMRHEIERLDRVVNALLDFTRPVELVRRPTDLNELVQAVHDLISARAEAAGVAWELQPALPPPVVNVDRDLVEQALLNLLTNALEAMASSPVKRLALQVARQGEEAVILVRDSGPGIPEDIHDKIFDLYFSTRESGNGIGLALTARIMELHQGAAELLTIPGESGACFGLRFPLRSGNAAAAAEPPLS